MGTLVVDNGAGIVKAGVIREGVDYGAPSLELQPFLLHNCTAKSRAEKKFFVADGIDTAVDLAALYIRRPHDRGYIVNWDVEQEVWERMCHKDVLGIKPSETSVLVTEPLFSPNELKDNLDEFIFEEMGFQRYCTAPPALLALADHKAYDPDSVLSRVGCGVIVDSGFSFTHVVPFYEGRILYKACKRVDIGGKLLTNLLKETVSFRQWNMMDETLIMNGVKERLTFVSLDLNADLAIAKRKGPRNTIRRQYLLPTGIEGEDRLGKVLEPSTAAAAAADGSPTKRPRGSEPSAAAAAASRARLDDECVLELSNERFTVPEALFSPEGVIGLRQGGLVEAIRAAVESLDPQVRPLLYSTVVPVGGNALIPNMPQRLAAEVRALAPCEFDAAVVCAPPQRADHSAWRGGVRLAGGGKLEPYWVSKAEYDEKGHALCRTRMRDIDDVLAARPKASAPRR